MARCHVRVEEQDAGDGTVGIEVQSELEVQQQSIGIYLIEMYSA